MRNVASEAIGLLGEGNEPRVPSGFLELVGVDLDEIVVTGVAVRGRWRALLDPCHASSVAVREASG